MDIEEYLATADGAGRGNKLLDALSTDDDFRELFVSDACSAPARVGYVQPEGGTAHPGICLQVTLLASKENLARDRASPNSVRHFVAPRELRGEAWNVFETAARAGVKRASALAALVCRSPLAGTDGRPMETT